MTILKPAVATIASVTLTVVCACRFVHRAGIIRTTRARCVLENLKPSARVNMPSVLQDYKAGEVIRKASDKIDLMTYAQTVKQTKTDKWSENLFTPGRVEDLKVTVAHAFSVPDVDLPSQTATTTLFDHEGGVRAAADDTLAPHRPITHAW